MQQNNIMTHKPSFKNNRNIEIHDRHKEPYQNDQKRNRYFVTATKEQPVFIV